MSNKRIFKLFIFGLLLVSSGLLLDNKATHAPISKNPIPSVAPTVAVVSPTTTAQSTSSAVLGDVSRVQAQIVKVVDGDTIHVLLDSKKETVRLIGVDTPETVDPRKKVQCFGKEASAYAKSLLEGKTVYLEEDDTQGTRDKYQRLLAYVFLEDGTNINQLLISQGYAYEYTYNDPYKYQAAFKESQRLAQEQKIGLWADNTCFGKR